MSGGARGVLRVRRRLLDVAAGWRHASAWRELAARVEASQRAAWAKLSPRTREVCAALEAAGAADAAPLDPRWAAHAAELGALCTPAPPFGFTRAAVVGETMLVRGRAIRRRELAWLRRHVGAALDDRLVEDAAGCPALAIGAPPASATLIHHVFHLERFRACTGVAAPSLRTIVEWGAGFGSLARVLRRQAAAGREPTYVIFDVPVVAALAWTYLATIFGEDAVDVLTRPDAVPRPGRIAIAPASFANRMALAPDLFVSTWALSEAPPATQAAIAEGGFMGAPHLLLAAQLQSRDYPDAAGLRDRAEAAGARCEPTAQRGSVYLFR